MNLKVALTGLLSFVAGFGAHALLGHLLQVQQSSSDHWKIVNAYRAHLLNPGNYKFDPQVGLSSTKMPPDPQPSLFALVNAGELEHLNIVLPKVLADKKPIRSG